MKRDLVIDTCGLFCPAPIIKTAEALKNLRSGAVVEVVSDDPAIELDLPAWCQSTGHELQAMTREGRIYRFRLRKK
jgi:tRNA 2-thiouridine synthesizing protein A